MSDTTSSEGALAIMEIYNRVVKANNHVLGFTSEACRKSFHKNELKLPSELEKIQMAFNDIMAVNRGEFRRPIHGEIV
jgi:hypothetical protein